MIGYARKKKQQIKKLKENLAEMSNKNKEQAKIIKLLEEKIDQNDTTLREEVEIMNGSGNEKSKDSNQSTRGNNNKNDETNSLQNELNENKCTICKKRFNSIENLELHTNKEHKTETCKMCDKSFSKDNMNRHIKDNNCKLNTTCNKCGLICESNDKLENHMKNEHNNRQVCKYYRMGHCLKGNNCLFEHKDRQNNFNNSNMKLQNKVEGM